MKKLKNKAKKAEPIIDKKAYLAIDDQDESVIDDTKWGDRKSFVILLKFARPYQKQILQALSLMLISSVLAIWSSKLMGDLIEKGLMKRDFNDSLFYSTAIVFLEIASIYFIWIGRKKLAIAASAVIFKMRQSLFAKLQVLPLKYYDRQPQGRIVTRITHDVEGIEDFFTSSLGNLISALMMTVFAMGAMLVSDFRLGAIMVISIIPSIFLMLKTKDLMRFTNRRVAKYSSAINAKLSEYLNGISVIRSFGLEKWSMKEFSDAVDLYLQAQLKGNFLFAWSMPMVSFCATVPLIGLVWYGGDMIFKGTLTLGVFIAFVRYYERFFNPLMLLSREIHVVQQAFTNTERVMNFLTEDDEEVVLKNYGKMIPDHFIGDIKFDHVFMSYSDEKEWVLKDLNFHIKPGEKIGLVGKTGCGKSSTVSLLSRLYEYQQGEIYIDDIPIRNFDRHNLRSQIGFVSQDAIIFKGTLRDNLSSDSKLSDQHLIDASQSTGLVRALSREGFNLEMEILEGGTNLSIGERQLVSLTRVLINNPSLLILDEATANIDPFCEEIIHLAVMNAMKDRTCLIIAHRLDTLKECDRVFVFSDGQIIESGTLEELHKKGEHFFNLHYAGQLH